MTRTDGTPVEELLLGVLLSVAGVAVGGTAGLVLAGAGVAVGTGAYVAASLSAL